MRRLSSHNSLRAYGELYIYQVGDWYQLAEELTSMLPNHVLLVAMAAFVTGTRLPCQRVEPRRKRWQRPTRRARAASAPVGQPQRLGQLGFADLS